MHFCSRRFSLLLESQNLHRDAPSTCGCFVRRQLHFVGRFFSNFARHRPDVIHIRSTEPGGGHGATTNPNFQSNLQSLISSSLPRRHLHLVILLSELIAENVAKTMVGFPRYLQLQLAATLFLLQGPPAHAFLSSTAARKSMLQQKGNQATTSSSESTALPGEEGKQATPSSSSTTALGDEVVPKEEVEPIVEKTSDRDGLVQTLQTEVASLRDALTDQKESYDASLFKLRKDSDEQVHRARDQLAQVRIEYSSFKEDTTAKLEQAASPEEINELQVKVGDLKELKDSIKCKLDDALSKLKDNLEGRKKLQVEMVLMKQGYLDKLRDVEDELEGAQDARVRDQQESSKQLKELQEKSSKTLRDAIADGRKQVEDLTLDYTRRISVKDEELASTKDALGVSQTTIAEKEAVISQLEDEANSLRKLMKKSYELVKGRVSKRLRSLVPRKLRRKQ
jgi:hypothetical protein